jgi:Zn-dependent protease
MFIESLHRDPRFFMAVVITVVVSICLHELSHGIVAIWRGDRTPIDTGHMTLNPVVHMGGFSLICLVIAGISWGQMPVDPTRLKGKYAESLVALAGPLCNVILALLALSSLGLWFRLDSTPSAQITDFQSNLSYLLWIFGIVNIELAIFNLIPVPPLDGSRVLANLNRGYAKLAGDLEMNGAMGIVFLMIFMGAGKVIFEPALSVADHVLRFVIGH